MGYLDPKRTKENKSSGIFLAALYGICTIAILAFLGIAAYRIIDARFFKSGDINNKQETAVAYGGADVVQKDVQKETEPNKETSNDRQKIQDGQAEKMNENKKSLVEEDSQQSAFVSDSANQSASEKNNVVPFYGIWCYASENEAVAENVVLELIQKGMDAKVFVTTDWSNLNSTVWYAVTAGTYFSKEAADAALPVVQSVYPNAYVKYSGDFQGSE